MFVAALSVTYRALRGSGASGGPHEEVTMNILRFPKIIKLDLPDRLRQALDLILEHRPDIRTDDELLLRVVAEGVATVLEHEKDRVEPHATVQSVADRMERRLKELAKDATNLPAMATIGSMRPFPKITKRYKDPRKQHVESYVATVITKDVQERLQLFLDTHTEADLESLLATLIGVGLDRVEKDPKILKPDPAEEFAKLARSSPPVTASIVEDEIALEERLRKKLTKFLAAHPDAMKREHARKLLADLGAHRG